MGVATERLFSIEGDDLVVVVHLFVDHDMVFRQQRSGGFGVVIVDDDRHALGVRLQRRSI